MMYDTQSVTLVYRRRQSEIFVNKFFPTVL